MGVLKGTLEDRIEDFFGGYVLNEGQKRAVASLSSFLISDREGFILKGYAGTGKTFLINGIVRYLKSLDRNVVLMAPTGRAAKVIQEKTGFEASTIHRAIYGLEDIKDKTPKIEGDSDSYKLVFSLVENKYDVDAVFIIDEASMIDNVESEAEFVQFGSSYLLNDLIKFINPHYTRRKVIFIGDPAQLPPVNQLKSLALDQLYLAEQFNMRVTEIELEEVVRQSADSGILNIATEIRSSLKTQDYDRIYIDTDYPDISSVSADNFLDKYLSVTQDKIDEDTIILAQTNSMVGGYNRLVREHFFPDNDTLAKGDKILFIANNYSHQIPITNGTFGIVTGISNDLEKRRVGISRNKIKETIELNFRDIEILVKDEKGLQHSIRGKMIENVLLSKERALTRDETQALYVDFKIRNKDLKENTEAYKSALKSDPYLNALKLKFGYAVTCHKAQGGEWKNVFVDFTGTNYHSEDYFRWAYTAITRSREMLYTINEPRYHRHLKPEVIVKDFDREDIVVAELLNQQEISLSQPFLKGLYYSVLNLLKDFSIKAVEVEELQYCLRLFIFTLEGQVTVDLIYNKKNRVTNIRVVKASLPEIAGEIDIALTPLRGKEIILETKEKLPTPEVEIIFPSDKPFLKNFYDQLVVQLLPLGISVTDVKHHNYLEKYEFQRGSAYANFDIYYNNRGKITKCIPKTATTSCPKLLEDLYTVLGRLKND